MSEASLSDAGPLIEARQLSKVYQRGRETVRALQDVSFCIERGEFVAIVGPSGSGKTTLLNLLGCMDTPTTGSLHLIGRAVEKLSEAELTRLRSEHLGFVFQHFGLLPTLSVAENIALPALFDRRAQRSARALTAQRVDELLDVVGLAPRRRHRPHELSGGEMQRVAVARALINRPVLLLADEPTGNLDSATGATIIDLFRRLHTSGLTVVVVTHNADLAAAAPRHVRLHDGQIA